MKDRETTARIAKVHQSANMDDNALPAEIAEAVAFVFISEPAELAKSAVHIKNFYEVDSRQKKSKI